MKPLAHLLLPLFLTLPAAAQITSMRTSPYQPKKLGGGCEARVDVNALSGDGSALHFIDASGSYVVTDDIQCGWGETAIAIGPNARYVSLDLQGFSITGDPASSLHAIEVRPSAGPVRVQIHIFDQSSGTLAGFSGAAVQVAQVETLSLTNVRVADSDAALRNTGGYVRYELKNVMVTSCGSGVDVTGEGELQLSHCYFGDCAVGVSYCGTGLYVDGTTIEGASGDGLAYTDGCLSPGTSYRVRLVVTDANVVGNGGDGVRMTLSGDTRPQVTLTSSRLSDNGASGLRVDLSSSLTGGSVYANQCAMTGNAGDGASMSGNNFEEIKVTYTEYDGSHNGGSGIHFEKCMPKLQESVCNDNGGSGVTTIDGGLNFEKVEWKYNTFKGAHVVDQDGLPPAYPVVGSGAVIVGNGGGGLVIDECLGGELNEVVSTGNTGPGLELGPGASGTRVRKGMVSLNTGAGVDVLGTGNLVLSCSASGNGTSYSFAAGNAHGPVVPVTGVGDVSSVSFHPHTNYEY